MHRLIILGGLMCMLSSGQSKPPAELLTQDQMVSILVDLELAKAMSRYYTDDEDTARWLLKKNILLIYQAYAINLDTFQKSYQYYFTHFETMKEIYELVIKQIEELAEQL